jgi:NAD(P)-dependent dehydrogenase (short-subunit alcohol dehydrogenase family)
VTLAVVTGATGGLGSACARAFAEAGARLVLVSRGGAALDALAAELDATAIACDLTDDGAVDAALFGLAVPDVLVGCAGGNRPRPFLELSGEDLDWAWRVNVRAALAPAQACARRMVAARHGGAIVTVTSQMGHVGGRDRTAYCAAKHAVEGASRALALELAPHGIRVNTVAPTFVETPMTQPFLGDPEFRADVLARIPLGRLGRAEEVAAAVLFAASNNLMTGACVRVDGGWTAQ